MKTKNYFVKKDQSGTDLIKDETLLEAGFSDEEIKKYKRGSVKDTFSSQINKAN